MINLMGYYKTINTKCNARFILTPTDIYIQTNMQKVKLVWNDKKKPKQLRRLSLLIDCGIVSSYDDLFYQIRDTNIVLCNVDY